MFPYSSSSVNEQFIKKKSGDLERFDQHKLHSSLVRAGATSDLAQEIVSHVARKRMRTTNDIHRHTLNYTLKRNMRLAIQYNLKEALLQLGPSGFPFEQYMAELLRSRGYRVVTNRLVPGQCVTHEVDLILKKDGVRTIVECKFRNQIGSKIDVKIPLYFHSRMRDIFLKWNELYPDTTEIYAGMIITNTKFTLDAIAYSKCNNISLLGWGYPENNNIATWIDNTGLIPVTAIPFLNNYQKSALISKGIVMCKQLEPNIHVLKKIGLSKAIINNLLFHIREFCGQ